MRDFAHNSVREPAGLHFVDVLHHRHELIAADAPGVIRFAQDPPQPMSDAAQHAIMMRDMDDRILYWNHGAELMYGWLSSQALGRAKGEVLKSEYFEPIEQIHAALHRHGRWQGESIQIRRDGARLTAASFWSLQRDAAGVPTRILSIENDISAVVNNAGGLQRQFICA